MAVNVEGVKAVVLDIENNLETLWTSSGFQPYLKAFPVFVRTDPSTFLTYIHDLMRNDTKDACLKALQGYLWRTGYEDGTIRCPLFPDVAPVLQKWHRSGLSILIYSSGSVAAQKLLFQYTEKDGDLRPLLTDYFDTLSAGSKTESSSYTRIIAESNVGVINPYNWLFCSDRVAEVDAATAAGMRALLVDRPGNDPLSLEERARYQIIESFAQIECLG